MYNMPLDAVASISIHAPRVGRDFLEIHKLDGTLNISIHAPRVGRDTI